MMTSASALFSTGGALAISLAIDVQSSYQWEPAPLEVIFTNEQEYPVSLPSSPFHSAYDITVRKPDGTDVIVDMPDNRPTHYAPDVLVQPGEAFVLELDLCVDWKGRDPAPIFLSPGTYQIGVLDSEGITYDSASHTVLPAPSADVQALQYVLQMELHYQLYMPVMADAPKPEWSILGAMPGKIYAKYGLLAELEFLIDDLRLGYAKMGAGAAYPDPIILAKAQSIYQNVASSNLSVGRRILWAKEQIDTMATSEKPPSVPQKLKKKP